MATISYDCPACGKSTNVSLDIPLSKQSCHRCKASFYRTTSAPREVEEPKERQYFHLKKHDPDQLDEKRKAHHHWVDALFKPLSIGCLVIGAGFVVKSAISSSAIAGNEQTVRLTETSVLGNPKIDEAWKTQVRDLAAKYLQASSVDELIPMTRRADQQAERMRRYYPNPGSLPIGGQLTDRFLLSKSPSGETTAMLIYTATDLTQKQLVIGHTSEGLKMDWPSMTGVGEMTLDEFLTQKPQQPVLLHVAAWLGDYFNFAFANSQENFCLRLSNLDDTRFVYGYLSVDKRPDVIRVGMLTSYQEHVRNPSLAPQGITIKAKFPEGKVEGPGDQVIITEVICRGWYVP